MVWKRIHSNTILACILGFITLALTAFVSLCVFDDFPFTQDEYTYLYQAQIFALGKLSIPVAEQLKELLEPCIVLINGHLFSKYPPGFSALLTLGVLAKNPGLVNPILSAITVAILFIIIRKRCGLVPTLCVMALLISSPLLLGYGGSYFSQPLSLLLTAIGFWGLLRYGQTHNIQDVLLGGVAAGILFLVRPLDAFCLGLTIASAIALIAPKGERIKPLIAAMLITASGAIMLFLFNFIMSGEWTISVYPVIRGQFRIIDQHAANWMEGLWYAGLWYVDSISQYMLSTFVYYYVPFLGPGLGAAAMAGLFVAPKRIMVPSALFCFLIVALYNFHPSNGYPVYGARYWYPTLIPVSILAGYGFHYLWERRGTALVASLVALVFCAQLARDVALWHEYTVRFAATKELRNEITKRCPPHSSCRSVFDAAASKQMARICQYEYFVPQSFFLTGNICSSIRVKALKRP